MEGISAALDGELSPVERNALDEHLANCPDCAALFHELAGQSRLLRELDCQVPEDLSERILSRLPEQISAPPVKRRVIHWRRWGTMAACLVLVVWAGLALPQQSKNAAPQAETVSLKPVAPGAEQRAAENQTIESAEPSANMIAGPSAFSLTPDEASLDSASPGPALKSMPVDGVQHLPLSWSEDFSQPAARLLDDSDALSGFLAQYPQDDLTEAAAAYDEGYFETAALLAVTLEESSGSVSHTVEGVFPADDGWEIVIRRQVPEVGTCDMAAWLILIETDRSVTAQDTLTVVLTD